VGKAFPRIYVVEGRLLVIHANQENSHRLMRVTWALLDFSSIGAPIVPVAPE
jgi:hypothetical protein